MFVQEMSKSSLDTGQEVMDDSVSADNLTELKPFYSDPMAATDEGKEEPLFPGLDHREDDRITSALIGPCMLPDLLPLQAQQVNNPWSTNTF